MAAGGRLRSVDQTVSFTLEQVDQDAYRFRIVEVWPAGQEPDRSLRVDITGPSPAYRSRLVLRFEG